jgi:exodeoxyribonuclease I
MGTCRKADAIRLAISDEPYALTEFYYGREHTFPVVHCGSNSDYDAQVGVFDLRNDPTAYLQSSADDLIDILNASPKVIRTIRANAQPIIMPLASLPDGGKTNLPGDDIIAERADAICADVDFRRRVGQAMASRFADREPAEHLEQRIYDGFPNRADQSLMDQFHQTDWQGRRKIAERLSDRRVREYARRLIYMEAPEILSDDARAEMDAWIRDRVLTEDTKVPWNTIPKAMRENDKLLAKATGSEAVLMNDVRKFLVELAKNHATL